MFVSKILGKHSPINARELTRQTRSLANIYFGKGQDNVLIHCERKTLVIGFAETAVAMAQSFFDTLLGDVSFVHSTRETPEGAEPLFSFREVHSHAPFHNFFLNDTDLIKNAEEIILVDDELTSGNTALGVIEKINTLYPGKTFGIASFLDWRSPSELDNFKRLEDAGISIKCRALLKGNINLDKVMPPPSCHMPEYKVNKKSQSKAWKSHHIEFEKTHAAANPFLKHTGRFGLSRTDRLDLERKLYESAETIKKWLPEGKSLFLGTGEFLYIPLKLAEYCGSDISFQSITRTPNLPLREKNYDISSLDVFPSPFDPSRNDYLYNLDADSFDNIVLLFERRWSDEELNPLLSVLESKNPRSCHLVFFCE